MKYLGEKMQKESNTISDWYWIPRSNIRPSDLIFHMESLTHKPKTKGFKKSSEQSSVENYQLNEEYFGVPRYYGIKNFGIFVDKIRRGKQLSGERLEFNQSYSLKSELHQVEAFEKTMDSLKSQYGSAILSLPTGYGKTITSLYIYSKIKVCCLIIVSNSVMMKEWRDKIQNCLPKVKIGVLKNSKNYVDYSEFDIVLSMYQTVSNSKLRADFSSFGMVIMDEAHHASAKKYSKCLPLVSCRYMIALSATPNRKDKNEIVLSQFVGPVTFAVERPPQKEVTVERIVLKYQFPMEKRNSNGTPDYVKMLNDIAQSEERTRIIARKIIESIRKDGGQHLILSERRSLLKEEEVVFEIPKEITIPDKKRKFELVEKESQIKSSCILKRKIDFQGNQEKKRKKFEDVSFAFGLTKKKLEDIKRKPNRIIIDLVEDDEDTNDTKTDHEEKHNENVLIVEEETKIIQVENPIIFIENESLGGISKFYPCLAKIIIEECPDLKVAHLFGGCNVEKEREKAKHADLIFSTYQMCSEGLDISSTTRLHCATPKATHDDLKQIFGRVSGRGGSHSAIIYDYIDPFSFWERKAEERLESCRIFGYTINNK